MTVDDQGAVDNLGIVHKASALRQIMGLSEPVLTRIREIIQLKPLGIVTK